MSRYHQKTLPQLLKSFWERKIKKVVQTSPANEKHWPMTQASVIAQLSQFAEKNPQRIVDVRETKPKDVILSVKFKEWPSDMVLISIGSTPGSANLYVLCGAGA